MCHSTDVEDGSKNDGYCQLFFNGAVETVSSDIIRGSWGKRVSGGVGGIASFKYEQDVIQAVTCYLKGFKELQVSAPLAISMALLGCRGSFLHVNERLMSDNGGTIDRDVAILPDVVIESLDVEVSKAIKPAFDALWNACGFPGSFNYDDRGDWKPRR